jgi:dTDP-4-dehydrorhamnose reductase
MVDCMRIYVTGGTGLVGSNVIKVAVERHGAEVFATLHRWQAVPLLGYEVGPVDVRNRDQVLESARAFQPDAIVHCAALLDLPLLYREREVGWQSYVESTRFLTEAANEVGAKMVFISSDWVFDGTQIMAEEGTPPNPINYYGVLKVVAETLVAATARNWAVIRVAGVNGVNWARPELPQSQNAGVGNLAVAVARALRAGDRFMVWEGEVNMRGTPTLASEIGEVSLRIIQLDRCGIFHCCASEGATRLELAHAVSRTFELDVGLIRVGPPDPADPLIQAGIPIPRDTSMRCTDTARQLSYQPPGLGQLLRGLRRQMETGKL